MTDRCFRSRIFLIVMFIVPFCIFAHGQTQNAAQVPTQTAQIKPPTTTVVVVGHPNDDYLPVDLSVGSFDKLPLLDAPVSATVVTRDLLTDQFSRVLSDVVKNDASIGEDYAPVGYYGDFQIRGFTIDLATGLQVNGMTVAGEQDVPLENKERVEFLKGIAGLESGITTAGGLINYVTKRPTPIKSLEIETDHRGTAYGAVDLGQLYGSAKQVGIRVNLAGESIKSYVKDANGWRTAGTFDGDWKLTPTSTIKGDFEYQHKVERSVSGYQLLGGTTVPNLHDVFPSVMLGEQSWAEPNTFDTFNSNARYDKDLPRNWHAFAAASLSHSLIDDNVVYAYGCYYEALCQGNGGSAPDYFFAPDGGYDIYDYRDPGELRIDAQAEAIVTGHLRTGSIEHDVTAGGTLFHRSVQQPGEPPTGAPSTVQDGAVYTYVGSENIYQPIQPVAIESPHQSAGPQTLYEDDHQTSFVVQDRIHLPEHIQLFAGGRLDDLRDHNYSAEAVGQLPGPQNTDKTLWLPQYAATWNPITSVTLYGNYSVMLSLGPQAPFWAINSSLFLGPFFTRQAEVGAKFEPDHRILLSTALFRMRAPFFYPKFLAASDPTCTVMPGINGQCFEADGRETHDGIELGAQGKAANWLRLSATAAGILATADGSGTAAYNGKQVINVPRVRVASFADISLPSPVLDRLHLADFHILPGWGYTGRKEATRDDSVSVPGYNLFNLGARYTPGGEGGKVSFRIFADNTLDKRYWKDTGASYGDTFLHLGAPTTVRVSAQYTF
jgi:iron complex outermembrane receptor protein